MSIELVIEELEKMNDIREELPDSFIGYPEFPRERIEQEEEHIRKKIKTDESTSLGNMIDFCQNMFNIKVQKPKLYRKSTITNRLDRLKNEHDAKVYKYGLIPPIVKNDIRRYYPNIFAYVHNSCDYGLLKHFMNTFMDENILLNIKRPSLLKEDSLILQGFRKCGQVWFGRIYDVPDVIFRTYSSIIKLRADQTAVITTEFHCIGTRLIDPISKKNCDIGEKDAVDLNLNDSFDNLVYHRVPTPVLPTQPIYLPTNHILNQYQYQCEYAQRFESQCIKPHSQAENNVATDFFDSLEFANDVMSIEEEKKYSQDLSIRSSFHQLSLSTLNSQVQSNTYQHLQMNTNHIPQWNSTPNSYQYPSDPFPIPSNNNGFALQDVLNIPILNNPKPFFKKVDFHGKMVMGLNPEMKITSLLIEKID